MTDDARIERLLADVLAADAPSSAPDRLLPESLRAARGVRRWPRWLCFLKEPPMRISSRVAVGSPTVRVVSVLVLILVLGVLATGAVVGGATLLSGPALIVGDPAGASTTTTIAAAVAMAQDGDTIQVRPGTYAEHIVIDKDITLEGDPGSSRDSVVIPFTLESPKFISLWDEGMPNAVTVTGADATLRHLTFQAPKHGVAVHVAGVHIHIEDLAADFDGEFDGIGHYVVYTANGATGTLRDVTCDCAVAITEGSVPTVEGLELTDVLIINGPSTKPVVDHSVLTAVWVQDGAQPTLTENSISGGVSVDSGSVAEMRGNVIDGERNGDVYGVKLDGGDAIFVGNTVRGQVTGFDIGSGDTPTIEGNAFEHNTTAINVGASADAAPEALAKITGNTFCGNLTNLTASGSEGATPAGNQVCDADASASP